MKRKATTALALAMILLAYTAIATAGKPANVRSRSPPSGSITFDEASDFPGETFVVPEAWWFDGCGGGGNDEWIVGIFDREQDAWLGIFFAFEATEDRDHCGYSAYNEETRENRRKVGRDSIVNPTDQDPYPVTFECKGPDLFHGQVSRGPKCNDGVDDPNGAVANGVTNRDERPVPQPAASRSPAELLRAIIAVTTA